ncbi:transglutaminaseTgpA domain-containing protein [Oleiharenicola sp. Vm1]|uniref:transglutaminaseTgpA domain-containing protein n=1 Tax=Oleiharenicola sp. Vm1 TaxID=3398393 RepID=UPI0039F5472B
MASPRPQLSLDELRRLKWLLGGALALVSLWTVFFLDVEALGLVALASGVIAAAVVWPQLPARVPALGWRLAVPAIVVAVAVDFHFSTETLPVLIRLAVLLVLYRAVAYRRKREDLQLIVLGLFLIVVAGVLTVAMEFALLLLVFTGCALGFLFVVTLIDMVDTGPRVMRPEEMREVPAWARGRWRPFLARLRAATDWRLLGVGSALFAAVVAISALLFLLIPRFEIGSSFFLDKYLTRKSRTGFSDTVRFGDVGELVQDHSVALRVDLPAGPRPAADLYWRLVTLDEYTPEGFRISGWMKAHLRASQSVRRTVPGGGVWTSGAMLPGGWTIYLEPGVSRYLPLPGSFAVLRLRDAAPVQVSPPNRLVALPSEPAAMTAFQIEGIALAPIVRDAGFGALLQGWVRGDEAMRREKRYDARTMLAGPAGPENAAVLQRVLREVGGGAALPAEAFAERATAWLRQRHAYAPAVRIPRGRGDDIVRWLDSNEPGFCEHFASALAVLCRAAGHPARVVAGFHGGALNGFEDYLMVRNSDAHAWVEVFNGADAWVRVDPTPGGAVGTVAAAAAPVEERERDHSWTARFDSLRVLWYRRVVSFDARQQVELLDSVKSATTGAGDVLRARLEAWAQRLKAWLAGPWDWARAGRVLAGVALVAAALVGGARGVRWAWGRWQRGRHPAAFDPVRRAAGRALARIRGRGTASGGRGPEAAEIAAVTADLERLRYGRRETWPEARAVFRRARRVTSL